MRTLARLVPAAAMLLCACGGGQEAGAGRTPGVDLGKKVIRIGMLNDESGPVAAIGRPFAAGKRVLMRQVNAGGSGLLQDGWTLEYVERDHGYNPQRSVQLFNEIRDDVLFIGGSFGTPNTLPLRPLLERNQLVAFPVSLSSKMAEFEFTPPLGPSYKTEVRRGLDWAVEHAGGPDKLRVGLVYQQDDYGLDGLEALTDAARQLGVKIVAQQTYAAGQADYTAVVTALKSAGATHVFLTAVPSATAPILGIAAQLDYKPVWLGNSPAWIDRFFDGTVVPASIFENFHWLQSVAFWGEDVPFMPAFLAAYEKYGRELAPPDTYVLQAYASGLTQLEIVRRTIASGDVTRAGFLKTLRAFKDYDTQGVVAESPDFTRLPYHAGGKSRVLKPDFSRKSWKVAGGYATPTTLNAAK